MLSTKLDTTHARIVGLPPNCLVPNSFSVSLYGDPDSEIDDLMESIRTHGILVPLVVTPSTPGGTCEVISGHRRLALRLPLNSVKFPAQFVLYRWGMSDVRQSWNSTVIAERRSANYARS